MYEVIIQTALLIGCGVILQWVKPQGLEGVALRRNLTGLVYVLLLPALVLVVLWRAPLSLDSFRVAAMAATAVISGLILARLIFSIRHPGNAALGALMLAAAFPNATYMGLPVLEAAFGPWARSVAIQYDLFACTPLLLSVGIVMAAHYGGVKEGPNPLKALIRVPPLWAAILGVGLNLLQVPLPEVFVGALDKLAVGVVPLMLISLGLGLRWDANWRHHLLLVVPIIVIQLLLLPLLIWGLSGVVGLTGEVRMAVILEAAMPSMVLGIVLCDRYNLDTGLYAMSVTLTTALSLFTLPFWFDWLGG